MSNFFKSMFSSSNEVSHKRFISLLSFTVLVVMVGLNAYNIKIDSNLIYVFASLCGGSSVLSVVDKFAPSSNDESKE